MALRGAADMIYCESPDLERWIAPPQEDFPRPTWTKLSANGVLLSNSLEYANWQSTPIEPIVCESCWSAGCSLAGLARIVHLKDHLLWLAPRAMDLAGPVLDRLSDDNLLSEPVMMPIATWERLRLVVATLPPYDSFPPATRGDVAALWMHQMPISSRVCDVQRIETSLRAAVASDPLDLEPARDIVSAMVRWFQQGPHDSVTGTVLRIEACAGSANTFYFDHDEWPCFLTGIKNSFVWGTDWAYTDEFSS